MDNILFNNSFLFDLTQNNKKTVKIEIRGLDPIHIFTNPESIRIVTKAKSPLICQALPLFLF